MLETSTRFAMARTLVAFASIVALGACDDPGAPARGDSVRTAVVANITDPTVATVTNVNTTNQGVLQAETSIAVSRANPQIMVGGDGDHRSAPNGSTNCGYVYSKDGGATWKSGYLKGITKGNGGPLTYDKGADPVVVYSAKHDTFHYLCLGIDLNSGRSAVGYAKSSDGGATWSTPQVVTKSTSAQTQLDKEMLAIDNGSSSPTYGRLYATWTRGSGASKVIETSYLNGTTWSTPVTVSGIFLSAHGPSVAVGGANGTAYIAFCWAAGQRCHGKYATWILVVRSIDGGGSWSTPVAASSFTSVPDSLPGNSFRLHSFPALSVNPNNGIVHLAFANWYAPSGANIQFTRSTTMGFTWDPLSRINSRVSDDRFSPWMSTSPGGSVIWVCYYDQSWNSSNKLDISCSRSTTGTSFETAIRVSSVSSPTAGFIGDYIGVDVTPSGGFRVLWTDFRSGNGESFTAGL